MSDRMGNDDRSKQDKMVDADLIAGQIIMPDGEVSVAIGFKGTKKALMSGIKRMDKDEYTQILMLNVEEARKYAEYILEIVAEISGENEDGSDNDTFVVG